MMDNRQKLKQAKVEYGYTRQQLSDVLGIPLATLNNYLAPPTSKSSRKCPNIVIDLLKYKLRSRKHRLKVN